MYFLQIKQTKSKFGFGTAFNANLINDNTHTAYQNWLYNNFEWAVPENAMKWKQMEWTHVCDHIVWPLKYLIFIVIIQ